MAWSQDVGDEHCLVGPVKDERSRDLSRRFQWAPDLGGSHSHRTLDEALQELLAEWEQH
jgi:hypothetical protein